MRDLHGLADASTPAYLTVWNRGGGTPVASRHSSDIGSMSTATVPSAYAFFRVMRTNPSSEAHSGLSYASAWDSSG
jgi:hypothetical protein